MKGALDGFRVLDLTQIMAGPFCGMLLADQGADVIKIEKPNGGDDSRRMGHLIGDESAGFLTLNRNKRGIALDIRTDAGKEILWKLIATADVIIENFRPGTLDRLGFGYNEVHARYPKVVYCSISGYGQTGPYGQRGGFDLVAQAMSGVLSVTGSPEAPAKVGVPIADLNAGLFASHAILAALLARTQSGEGQHIETSLLEAAMAYTIWESNEYWATGHVPERLGTAHRASAPYQVFETTDGHIAIGAANQRTWEALVKAIESPQLLHDNRFSTNKDRMVHLPELVQILTTTFKTKPTAEWQEKLDACGVPSGPVMTIDQVYQHPQVRAREMEIAYEHPSAGLVRNIGFPVKYSSTPSSIRRPAPLLGQHSFEILQSIGYSENQCETLKQSGVVSEPSSRYKE